MIDTIFRGSQRLACPVALCADDTASSTTAQPPQTRRAAGTTMRSLSCPPPVTSNPKQEHTSMTRTSTQRCPIMTTSAGAPVVDNHKSLSAGPRGPLLIQDWQLL